MKSQNCQGIFLKKIEFIKLYLDIPYLNIYLNSNFGSNHNNYRNFIREKIILDYQNIFSTSEKIKILNLDLIPKSERKFFSISHTQSLGGFSASSVQHGFDIELHKRLNDQIILRISDVTETTKAPNISYLWSAKESAFKALYSNDENSFILSDLKICEWMTHSKTQLYSYRIKSQKNFDLVYNTGFVFSDEQHIYSLFFK